MKNRLQYLYTITVFVGVLITAYMMINSEGSSHLPLRAMDTPNPTFRSEATVDPALQELFQMEAALGQIKKDKNISEKRMPSQVPKTHKNKD